MGASLLALAKSIYYIFVPLNAILTNRMDTQGNTPDYNPLNSRCRPPVVFFSTKIHNHFPRTLNYFNQKIWKVMAKLINNFIACF